MAENWKGRGQTKGLVKGQSGGDPRDKLWSFVKERFDEGLELRRPYEEKWIMNLSFLSGRQYVFYNQAAQMLQHLIQRKGRLRVVDNKLLSKFQKQVSRMIRNNPRVSVIPNSSDQDDIKAAKVGDKVLKAWWRATQMKKKVRQLAGWIYGCGNGFLDDVWNPKAGPMRWDGESGEMVYLGDAECNVWSPFEVGVPASGLNDVDLHSFPWLWKSRWRTLEYFRSNYERGLEVASENRPVPYVDASVLFGAGNVGRGQTQDGAIEIRLYVKPCVEFPKGKYLIGANGVILEESDFPFEHYFLEQFKDIEVPGVFWGMATLESAIWLQKMWNRTVSDVAEYNRVMARGKWLIPRNANVEVIPDDSHGQRLLYNPVLGLKPEMIDVKGLPETYGKILEICQLGLMEIFHQHEVTQGTNKSDIRSGEMVGLLLEQDDFGNMPTHAVFEESLESVMKRILQRVQKGYKEERVLSVVGKNNEIEVFNFKGADLRNNTDVNVAKESSLPDSKAMRQERTLKFFEAGLYGNPADEKVRERVLRMLEEVPEDVQDVFKESELDRQNAKIENGIISQHPEVVYLANSYDNHEIHVEEHNWFRKQPEYQRLKLTNLRGFVTLEAGFMKHLEFHMKFLEEAIKAQQSMMEKVEERG